MAIKQLCKKSRIEREELMKVSKSHDSLLVAAIAGGSVKFYDVALPPSSNPIRSLHEHTREVQSTDYNPVPRDSFITSAVRNPGTPTCSPLPTETMEKDGQTGRK